MTTDTTGAALLAIIRANPADWDARRVYADWLDDGSEEGAIAANGQRWQAWKRKRPICVRSVVRAGEDSCDWWERLRGNGHASLPSIVFHALADFDSHAHIFKEYPTPDAAEAALARALWELGIQVAQ